MPLNSHRVNFVDLHRDIPSPLDDPRDGRVQLEDLCVQGIYFFHEGFDLNTKVRLLSLSINKSEHAAR